MSDWTTVTEFTTVAGVTHRLEKRYDRSKQQYEMRYVSDADAVTFVRDRWYVTDESPALDVE